MKKLGKALLFLPWIVIALVLVTQVFWLFVRAEPRDVQVAKACPFCNDAVIAKQQYYEGKLVRVLLNYKPILTGHSLLIPKRHVERLEDLTTAEVVEMHATIQKVQRAFKTVYGTPDYLLVVQNGEAAGQTAYHTHMHMIPRKDNVVVKIGLWWLMLTRPLQSLLPVDWAQIEHERVALHEVMP